MGHPKKQRRKYETPPHPWRATRIEEEKKLIKEYGLKNKKEVWKAASLLRKFKSQAKKLVAVKTEQAKKEKEQLLKKLTSLNILDENGKLDDVLGLNIKNILNRRLQTQVYKRCPTRTVKQARQFIAHGNIFIDNEKVTVPSYLVLKNEEGQIKFNPGSKLADKEHPERTKK